jgi:hypothetical protein
LKGILLPEPSARTFLGEFTANVSPPFTCGRNSVAKQGQRTAPFQAFTRGQQ